MVCGPEDLKSLVSVHLIKSVGSQLSMTHSGNSTLPILSQLSSWKAINKNTIRAMEPVKNISIGRLMSFSIRAVSYSVCIVVVIL